MPLSTSRTAMMLSSAGNTYNRDYLAETPDGSQRPMLNVFYRDGGVMRHFWGTSSSTHLPTPGRTPATSAPSSRSGTFSTSPPRVGGRTGMSSCATREAAPEPVTFG